MAIKTTGAEFKEFWNDPSWCPVDSDKYVDDECIYVGPETDDDEPLDSSNTDYSKALNDADEVTLVGGTLNDDRLMTRTPLEKIFKQWKAARDGKYVVVYVPHDKFDTFKDALSEIEGVKIGRETGYRNSDPAGSQVQARRGPGRPE